MRIRVLILALSTILDPAIELAGEGVRVGERLGRAVADAYECGGLEDDGLREWAESAGVTLVNSVPSAVKELLREGEWPQTVRTVNLGGEPLRNLVIEERGY